MQIPTAEIVVNGRKKIVNADDPRVKGAANEVSEKEEAQEVGGIPTRSEIATMPKAQVIEWLEAHGVEAPEGKLADLKAALVKILYVEPME